MSDQKFVASSDAEQQIQSKEKLDSLFEEAKRYQKIGELDKALEDYSMLKISFNLNDDFIKLAEVLHRMGQIYNLKGELRPAIAKLKKARQIISVELPTSEFYGDILHDLGKVYHDDGSLKLAIDYMEKAVEIFQNLGLSEKISKVQRYIGFTYHSIHKYKKSNEYLELSIKTDNVDPETMGNTHNAIGLNYQALEEFEKAIEQYEIALEYYDISNNPYDNIHTLYYLTQVYYQTDHTQEALDTYMKLLIAFVEDPSHTDAVLNLKEMGLKIYSEAELEATLNTQIEKLLKKIQSAESKGQLYKEIAVLEKSNGNFEKALDYYSKAYNAFEAENNILKLAKIKQRMGLLNYELNNWREAVDHYKASVELFRQLDTVEEDFFYALSGLSNTYLQKGRPDDALKYLKEAIVLFEHSPGELVRATVLNNVGNTFKTKGMFDKALEYYHRALDLVEVTSSPIDEATTLHNLGETYYFMEEFDTANEMYHRALELYKECPQSFHEARTLTGIGNIYKDRGESKKAIQSYQKALTMFKDKNNFDRAYPLINLTDVYLSQGDYEEAIEASVEALGILEQSPNPYLKAIPLKKLGKIFYEQGEEKKAFIFMTRVTEIFEDSPNPNDINKPLNELEAYDPESAKKLALSSPLGCVWFIEKLKREIKETPLLDSGEWYNLYLAQKNIWHDYEENIETTGESIFTKNWKLKYLLEDATSKLTSSTYFNFLFGANELEFDIDEDRQSLRSTQPDLDPMFFVEIPPKLFHDQRFLKIRVNNLVKRFGELRKFPDLDGISPMINRIQLTLETQWFQKLEVEHVFYPTTDKEFEAFRNNPEEAWLSEIIIMDMGENLKKEDIVDVTFTIELFDNDDDVITKTTKQKISLPVIRTTNQQKLEKFRLTHSNSLAVVLAVWSIIMSSATFVYESRSDLSSWINLVNPLVFYGSGILVLIFGLFGFLWLRRSINKDISDTTVVSTEINPYIKHKVKQKADDIDNLYLTSPSASEVPNVPDLPDMPDMDKFE